MKTIPYGKQWIDQTDIKEVVKVLKSDWITQGPKVLQFENDLARYCGSKYAVAVSSGTAALHLAILALGFKKGDEVITSPLTFLATANAIVYAGAKPVFADISAQTGNIDVEDIQKKITKRTKAILPVHFGGHPADLEKIRNISRKHNLKVIEDAAHALGAEYKIKSGWIRIGSCRHSDMAIFSFHPVKSITTGEGGVIVTNDFLLYKRISSLRTHGMIKDRKQFKGPDAGLAGAWYYEMHALGFNYRITDLQCALGVSQLKKLDRFVNRRREISAIYNRALSSIKEIQLPFENSNVKSAWHLYSIWIKDRNLRKKRGEIFNRLRENGIGVQVHYIPVHLQPFYQNLGYKKGLCPKAEEFYEGEISLPLYPAMSKKDVQSVIYNTLKVFERVR